MSDTMNGALNIFYINGENQAEAHLPCFKIGEPGTIAGIPVSAGKVVVPLTIEGVVPFIVPFSAVNSGLSALLNIEDDSRVLITGFELLVTETITGTGGLALGYNQTGHEASLATVTNIVLTQGSIVKWSDATNIVLGAAWWRAIPKGQAFVAKATGTLTAGTLAAVIRYAIIPANPNP